MYTIIVTILIFLILLLLFIGAKLTMLFMRKAMSKKVSLGRAFVYFISFSFLALFGDFVLSNLVFNYYCSDKELVGQHIYERVALPDEILLPSPKNNKERSKVDVTLLIDNKNELIDIKKFGELYEYQSYKRSPLFPVGPIYKFEAIVTRKADGKLLGKAVSLTNQNGWISELDLFWLNTGNSCPKYKDKWGDNIINSHHSTLIDNIFYRKQ